MGRMGGTGRSRVRGGGKEMNEEGGVEKGREKGGLRRLGGCLYGKKGWRRLGRGGEEGGGRKEKGGGVKWVGMVWG